MFRIDKVKLVTEMAKREWRYKKLAEITGLSSATLSSVSGGKTISKDTAVKIAEAFNLKVEQILETR